MAHKIPFKMVFPVAFIGLRAMGCAGSQAPMVVGGPPLSSALEYMLRGPDTSTFFFHFGFQYVL